MLCQSYVKIMTFLQISHYISLVQVMATDSEVVIFSICYKA